MKWLRLLWKGLGWLHANPRWMVYGIGVLAVITTRVPTDPTLHLFHNAVWSWGLFGAVGLFTSVDLWWFEQALHRLALRVATIALVAWVVGSLGPSILSVWREEPQQMLPFMVGGLLALIIIATVPWVRPRAQDTTG